MAKFMDNNSLANAVLELDHLLSRAAIRLTNEQQRLHPDPHTLGYWEGAHAALRELQHVWQTKETSQWGL